MAKKDELTNRRTLSVTKMAGENVVWKYDLQCLSIIWIVSLIVTVHTIETYGRLLFSFIF